MQVHIQKRYCDRAVEWLGVLIGLLAMCCPVLGQTSAPRTPPAVGTIRAISSDSMTVGTDSGAEVKIQIPAEIKVFRVPPGSKDLKEAVSIALSDLQAGDRVLVRLKLGSEASSPVAAAIIAMKKGDIAVRNEKDREEWQRHGIGGLVTSVEPAQDTIVLKTLSASGARDITINVSQNTVLKRYAPGSVNFEEAKAAPITEILPGDQLRARGTRSADGNSFAADEIVSGSFRNIAGTVVAVNAAAGTLTLNDLATKKTVEVKVTGDSQIRKLPQAMAQRIALRLKGEGQAANASGTAAGQPGGPPAPHAGQGAASDNGNTGMAAGSGSGRNGGDLQQMLSHLPPSSVSEFQKGDAVMVVATSTQGDGMPTVISMLGGVEPILQASSKEQAASLLSPWSLNQGGAEPGTP